MNKPVIQGTKEHSALLATEETTRTHGADPSLSALARAYGESNSPDVIDYTLTMAKIDIDDDVDVEEEEEEEEIPNGLTDPENQANIDAEIADNKLREKQEKIGTGTTTGAMVQQVGGRRILEDLYQEGVIKESYSVEEQKKLVFWEEGGIMVLPEELKVLKQI